MATNLKKPEMVTKWAHDRDIETARNETMRMGDLYDAAQDENSELRSQRDKDAVHIVGLWFIVIIMAIVIIGQVPDLEGVRQWFAAFFD